MRSFSTLGHLYTTFSLSTPVTAHKLRVTLEPSLTKNLWGKTCVTLPQRSMLYLQALRQPGGNGFVFSPFGKHPRVRTWHTASPSIASPPQVYCWLCSCSTDKPAQTDQKPTSCFLGGLSEGILEITLLPCSKSGNPNMVGLGENWGFNMERKPCDWANYPGFNLVTGSQWQKNLDLTVSLMFREDLFHCRGETCSGPWSVYHFFPICSVSMKRRRN